MNPEEFEELMRASRVSVEVTPDRVERLVDSVFARIDAHEASRPQRGWRDLLAALMAPVLPPRFATLMAAAMLLGVVAGSLLSNTDTTAAESAAQPTSNPFLPIGS